MKKVILVGIVMGALIGRLTAEETNGTMWCSGVHESPPADTVIVSFPQTFSWSGTCGKWSLGFRHAQACMNCYTPWVACKNDLETTSCVVTQDDWRQVYALIGSPPSGYGYEWAVWDSDGPAPDKYFFGRCFYVYAGTMTALGPPSNISVCFPQTFSWSMSGIPCTCVTLSFYANGIWYGIHNITTTNYTVTETEWNTVLSNIGGANTYYWKVSSECADRATTQGMFYACPDPRRQLTFNSIPSNVVIASYPPDINGLYYGYTPFTRAYMKGAVVTLVASQTAENLNFQQWLVDGQFYSSDLTTTLTIDSTHTILADYQHGWQMEYVDWGRIYYGSNCNMSGYVRKPGASGIRLHFSEINIEPYYDTLSTDAGDKWSGYYLNVLSGEMAGDTIKLTLKSDWSVSGYFIIDRVDWQLPNLAPATRGGDLFTAALGPPAIFTKAYDDTTGKRTFPPEGYSERGSFHVGAASGVDVAYDYFNNVFTSGWLAMAFNSKESMPAVCLLAAYNDETGETKPIPSGYTQRGALHVSQGSGDYDGTLMNQGWLSLLYRSDITYPPLKFVIGLDDDTGWSEQRPAGYLQHGTMHITEGGANFYNQMIRSGWLEMWYRNDYILTADQGAYNLYVADKPTTVTSVGAPFEAPDGASQAIFKIYAFDESLGKTTLVGLSDVVDIEPGVSWRQSGAMEAGLEPGRLYAIGVVWSGMAQIGNPEASEALPPQTVGIATGSSLVSYPIQEEIADQLFASAAADKIYPILIELENPSDVMAIEDQSMY